MKVYHVVCDRPLQVGQRIVFDDNNRSGVYQRVMALADTAADVLSHPEKYPLPLEHHLDVAIRELAMEQVRRERYPDYPSRMACLYVSREVEPAKQWAAYFARLGRPTYAVVELEVEGRCFVGDALNCFDGSPDQADNLARAERYWQNAPNEDGDPIWEMLVDGDIRVVRVIEAINANIPE